MIRERLATIAAGVPRGLLAEMPKPAVMFFTTNTNLLTAPGATIAVHGIRYMSFLGLFLDKDVISLGVSPLPDRIFREQGYPLLSESGGARCVSIHFWSLEKRQSDRPDRRFEPGLGAPDATA